MKHISYLGSGSRACEQASPLIAFISHAVHRHMMSSAGIMGSTCSELAFWAGLQARLPDGRLPLLAPAMPCSSLSAAACCPCTPSAALQDMDPVS